MKKYIILDLGSGETCKNSHGEIRKMVRSVADLQKQTDKEIIIKWQLFSYIPGMESLAPANFGYAYECAKDLGIKTTASIFDTSSYCILQMFEIPFFKIACRINCYHLIQLISPKDKIIVSVDSCQTGDILKKDFHDKNISFMYCVPEYPANKNKYESFFWGNLSYSMSDHTVGFDLYHKYQPLWYEKHFYLKGQTGPDCSDFAANEETIKEIL